MPLSKKKCFYEHRNTGASIAVWAHCYPFSRGSVSRKGGDATIFKQERSRLIPRNARAFKVTGIGKDLLRDLLNSRFKLLFRALVALDFFLQFFQLSLLCIMLCSYLCVVILHADLQNVATARKGKEQIPTTPRRQTMCSCIYEQTGATRRLPTKHQTTQTCLKNTKNGMSTTLHGALLCFLVTEFTHDPPEL
jgi:hypothetical protein